MTFGARLAGDHRRPAVLRASGARTRSSRRRSTGDGWRPWVFGLAALLGAGITAFYMSRLFFMTFHGQRRWTDGRAPARVARPHDHSADRPGPRVASSAGCCSSRRLHQRWLEPFTGPRRRGRRSSPPRCCPYHARRHRRRRRPGLADVPDEACARGGAARARSLTLAARRDLFQDDVNEAVFMRPGQYLTRSLVFFDARGVDGAVHGTGRLHRRPSPAAGAACRQASSAPTPCRCSPA